MNQARLLGDLVPVIDFYPELEERDDVCLRDLRVLKTTTRTMHTIRYRTFTARTIHLYDPQQKWIEGKGKKRLKKYVSKAFQALTRGKARFTMDVVCAVGLFRFLEHRSREQTCEEMYQRYGIRLSTGTVSHYALEFLIRFELYHHQYFHRLAETMAKDGGYILGADGTGESGSDRILLLMDLLKGWTLLCGTIPTEKAQYITPFLKEIISRAGPPLAFIRDMGKGLKKAGEALPPGIPTRECNYHFLRDVGRDMMTDTYQEFRKALVAIKVRPDLAKLRKVLHQKAKARSIDLRATMGSLRNNQPVEDLDATLLTETYHLLSWILNYHEDACGQRFPYRLPWVYLYKRCRQGRELLSEIRWTATATSRTTYSLGYLKEVQKLLEKPFRNGPAALLANLEDRLTRSHGLFLELRQTLRISEDKGDIPRDQLFLSDEEALEMEEELKKFRDQLSESVRKGTHTPDEKIMVDHLVRHWDGLIVPNITVTVNGEEKTVVIPRAISLVDARFGRVKGGIRKRTGRKDTGHELNRYGALLCLLQNLHSDEYVRVMFGSMEDIPTALARLPKEEVDRAVVEFKTEQCRYDVTGARGKEEFETFMGIVKKVRSEVETTMTESFYPLTERCDMVPIPTDS